jgi:hypothetical protein
VEKIFDFHFNFRYGGIPLGIPLTTIEFAILDMMGKIAVPTGHGLGIDIDPVFIEKHEQVKA